MKTKELFAIGTIVRFSFSWFGRTNAHDGHKCQVLEAKIERRGERNQKYFRYTLEDLSTKLSPRASRIFKMTDSAANGTTLRKVR
jgi:hypothetical protein